jgi:hypothetical protein
MTSALEIKLSPFQTMASLMLGADGPGASGHGLARGPWARRPGHRQGRPVIEGLLGFGAMFALMALRVPIAVAMGLVGVVGMGLMRSWPAALSSTAGEFVDIGSYTLSVVPLFVLMGNFVTRAGMSRELYRAAYALDRPPRGGLAMSTIAACAGFGAICGSSIATTATMARVAMPEMERFNYAPSFAAGSVCAGATLGILIPPSVIMVIYGIMTEQSIGALFAAGVIPGIVATLFYLLASVWITRRHPSWGPPGDAGPLVGARRALGRIWGVLAAVRPGDGRHVRRLLHAHRGGRRRRNRRFPLRPRAAGAVLACAAGGAGRVGTHLGDAVHDRHRRLAVRQLPELH